MSSELKFGSADEEIRYWKDEAKKFQERFYKAASEELSDFQMSSRDLEAELDSQLAQSEAKVKELKANYSRSQIELETIREKYETLQRTSHHQIQDLETKLNKLETYRDELQKYIRELEQANDDLERNKRATMVSLEDFETRLNQAIERNVLLESELDEKNNLFIDSVQRLKDEARDLRQELAVREKKEKDSFHHQQQHHHNNINLNSPTTSTSKDLSKVTASNAAVATTTTTAATATTKPPTTSTVTTPNAACDETEMQQQKQPQQQQNVEAVSTPPSFGHQSMKFSLNASSLSSNQRVEERKLAKDVSQPISYLKFHKGMKESDKKALQLNLVCDILSRIGSMESKLLSCQPQQQQHKQENSVKTPNSQSQAMVQITV
ncbi:hypothetical protein HELRODRAFT_110400 [Helobdella robusta]|uniref:NUDE domain-containing protein n=1 Tax=Helobdella robusta TaxID=6412 RepID=T1EF19_HELRO|nr:hypothetical protein HELRODRAFT_110400 [Helobdella robusta]ESO08172.1 hypothetical protein HELRODRAFT_110400 [Helobdella robusta]